jgi:uncharacterized membrane protein YraQ (UPF0718 family)
VTVAGKARNNYHDRSTRIFARFVFGLILGFVLGFVFGLTTKNGMSFSRLKFSQKAFAALKKVTTNRLQISDLNYRHAKFLQFL